VLLAGWVALSMINIPNQFRSMKTSFNKYLGKSINEKKEILFGDLYKFTEYWLRKLPKDTLPEMKFGNWSEAYRRKIIFLLDKKQIAGRKLNKNVYACYNIIENEYSLKTIFKQPYGDDYILLKNGDNVGQSFYPGQTIDYVYGIRLKFYQRIDKSSRIRLYLYYTPKKEILLGTAKIKKQASGENGAYVDFVFRQPLKWNEFRGDNLYYFEVQSENKNNNRRFKIVIAKNNQLGVGNLYVNGTKDEDKDLYFEYLGKVVDLDNYVKFCSYKDSYFIAIKRCFIEKIKKKQINNHELWSSLVKEAEHR
jgi:hypothetical protein